MKETKKIEAVALKLHEHCQMALSGADWLSVALKLVCCISGFHRQHCTLQMMPQLVCKEQSSVC